MANSPDLYLGLSGINLSSREVEFGHGIVLRPTFAHVFSTDVLAFERPTASKPFHPGPWQASSRRPGTDITAELHIPASYVHHKLTPPEVADTIVTALRLWTDPQIATQLSADCNIQALRDRKHNPNDPDTPVAALLGNRARTFGLARADDVDPLETISWVVENWESAADLRASRPEFRLAMETFESAQYIPSSAMILVSLWGALEAIFSTNPAELRFRVSSYLAAYLAPRGEARLAKQREVAKLYDARSAAAHGNPKHGQEDVLRTFGLLRSVLLCMINEKEVPSKDDLDKCLFAS